MCRRLYFHLDLPPREGRWETGEGEGAEVSSKGRAVRFIPANGSEEGKGCSPPPPAHLPRRHQALVRLRSGPAPSLGSPSSSTPTPATAPAPAYAPGRPTALSGRGGGARVGADRGANLAAIANSSTSFNFN